MSLEKAQFPIDHTIPRLKKIFNYLPSIIVLDDSPDILYPSKYAGFINQFV